MEKDSSFRCDLLGDILSDDDLGYTGMKKENARERAHQASRALAAAAEEYSIAMGSIDAINNNAPLGSKQKMRQLHGHASMLQHVDDSYCDQDHYFREISMRKSSLFPKN